MSSQVWVSEDYKNAEMKRNMSNGRRDLDLHKYAESMGWIVGFDPEDLERNDGVYRYPLHFVRYRTDCVDNIKAIIRDNRVTWKYSKSNWEFGEFTPEFYLDLKKLFDTHF